MKEVLAIMMSGAVGTLFRYGVGRWSKSFFPEGFPYGTLIVNVIGCLLFGLIMQVGLSSDALPKTAKLAITVGFLGAFTTFSTFGYETFQLMKDGEWLAATANAGANLVLGLLAVFVGITVGRLLAG